MDEQKREKEEKPMIWKAIIVVAFILIANLAVFGYIYKENFTGFSGYAISQGVEKTYTSISPLSRTLFLGQWAVILLILAFVLFRDSRIRGNVVESKEISVKRVSSSSGTDLDNLYSVLQEKKKLKLSTISKAFDISEEQALEWCKILEAGNLANIDYPGVGQPVIKLVET